MNSRLKLFGWIIWLFQTSYFHDLVCLCCFSPPCFLRLDLKTSKEIYETLWNSVKLCDPGCLEQHRSHWGCIIFQEWAVGTSREPPLGPVNTETPSDDMFQLLFDRQFYTNRPRASWETTELNPETGWTLTDKRGSLRWLNNKVPLKSEQKRVFHKH